VDGNRAATLSQGNTNNAQEGNPAAVAAAVAPATAQVATAPTLITAFTSVTDMDEAITVAFTNNLAERMLKASQRLTPKTVATREVAVAAMEKAHIVAARRLATDTRGASRPLPVQRPQAGCCKATLRT
jgi:hypothetical protein